MRATIVLASILAQSLAGAIPMEDKRDYRTSVSDPSATRSFDLPPFPGPSGIIFTDREAEAAPEPVDEKRDIIGTGNQFGTGPDPTQVQITGLTYGGTGCPANSIGSAISSDRTVITLIMSDYVASIGPGITITEARKNCQLNLQLQYPGGFQYSILSAEYRGYADLDKGITGNQKSTYYFSGQAAQASTGTTWKGPYVGDYELIDTANSTSIVWSPCGQQALLNINSQLALTSSNTSASGFITTDSIDTSFVQQVYIAWQPCTK